MYKILLTIFIILGIVSCKVLNYDSNFNFNNTKFQNTGEIYNSIKNLFESKGYQLGILVNENSLMHKNKKMPVNSLFTGPLAIKYINRMDSTDYLNKLSESFACLHFVKFDSLINDNIQWDLIVDGKNVKATCFNIIFVGWVFKSYDPYKKNQKAKIIYKKEYYKDTDNIVSEIENLCNCEVILEEIKE